MITTQMLETARNGEWRVTTDQSKWCNEVPAYNQGSLYMYLSGSYWMIAYESGYTACSTSGVAFGKSGETPWKPSLVTAWREYTGGSIQDSPMQVACGKICLHHHSAQMPYIMHFVCWGYPNDGELAQLCSPTSPLNHVNVSIVVVHS